MNMLCALDRSREIETVRGLLAIQDVIATLFERTFSRSGRELVCRCWNHEPDRHPSCRVNPTKGAFYCPVCRHGGDVFQVIREGLDCSFGQALIWGRRNAGSLPSARVKGRKYRARVHRRASSRDTSPGVRRAYKYTDERGRLLYEKIRTPQKEFFYRRRLADRTWIWSIAGVRTVLYGLPLLRLLPWVFIVEGEKDVEALWDIGLPATTNPEGAGPGKWKPAYSTQLRKAGIRTAFIIPDNDPIGIVHARSVRASCRAHGIRAALVLLPDVPSKGDVSDYLAAGHTRRDLLRLIDRFGARR